MEAAVMTDEDPVQTLTLVDDPVTKSRRRSNQVMNRLRSLIMEEPTITTTFEAWVLGLYHGPLV